MVWEMGANLGHLSRCLPIAKKLQERGNAVLFAVSDTRTAAEVLMPARIPFVQTPQLLYAPSKAATVSYSDLLLNVGYRDQTALLGGVHGWLNLFSLYKPDVVIADHAPTALLAARIARIPQVIVGGAFCLPPDKTPMPAFFAGSEASDKQLAQLDTALLERINAVLRHYQCEPIETVSDLFRPAKKIMTTFPELDPYGVRDNTYYAGLYYGSDRGVPLDWPEGEGARILAYVRPNIPGFGALLEVFRNSPFRVVFAAPGTHDNHVKRFSASNIRFSNQPVHFNPLWPDADLAIGYGSAGFAAQALLSGIPQCHFPVYAEHHFNANQVEALGAGVSLSGKHDRISIRLHLDQLLDTASYQVAANKMLSKYQNYDAETEINSVAAMIAS
jgi:UDP:flavonoid glycosyltransferase YjiC (YdhE family)